MNEVVGKSSDADAARKRALLRQMGVDVWQTRQGPADPGAELSVARAASARPVTKEPATPTSAAARVLSQPEPMASTKATAQTPGSEPRSEPPQQKPTPPVAPFSVACLSKGRVLMLIEAGQSRAATRFALDVLAASSGLWGGESGNLTFDWPQPGVDNHAGALRKALGAFVAKQLDDQGPERVLVSREVAERLERLPDDAIVLAPMAELMVTGEQKRALWAQLEAHK